MPDPRIWPIPTSNDTNFLVTDVSQICLASNPNRVDTDFTNDSDDLIYLARGDDAALNTGIRLNANGGTYHIGLFNLFLGDVYAITDSQFKAANLCISEGRKP